MGTRLVFTLLGLLVWLGDCEAGLLMGLRIEFNLTEMMA